MTYDELAHEQVCAELERLGYGEHARAFRLAGARSVPAEYRAWGGAEVVRLRFAIGGEGPAGSVVAEVVRPDRSSVLLYSPRAVAAAARTHEQVRVRLPAAHVDALRRWGGVQDGIAAAVAEWLAARGVPPDQDGDPAG